MSDWFVISTKRNEEFKALQELNKQGLRALVPFQTRTVKHARRLVSRNKPLFPGYAFAQIDFHETPISQINHTRGVKSILCSTPNLPTRIRPNIIETLLEACEESGLLKPPQSLTAGERIRFSSGPLQDLLGTIEKVSGTDRIWVILDTESLASRVMTDADKIAKVEK